MDKSATRKSTTPKPLVSAFDLFIASTRLQPWMREFPTDLGGTVDTRDYRKSFELKLRRPRYNSEREDAGYDRNDFGPAANGMLAEIARATSAFPVAFQPQLIKRDTDNKLLFLADEPPASYFSDGGILHNKPFTETISTIFTRAASRPVDRWLVSVEPDPERIPTPDEVVEPNVAEVAGEAVMTIPRYQSIAADLSRLQEHRRRAEVAREKLAGIDEALLGRIDDLQGTSGEAQDGALRDWRDEILAASNYPDERQRRVLETLKRLATSPNSAKQWDEATVEDLEEMIGTDPQGAPDPGFEQRRIYHLLEMTRRLQARPELSDKATELAKAKLQLWGQFDRVGELLWGLFDREGNPPEGEPASRAAAAIKRLREGLGSVAREVEGICKELDEIDDRTPPFTRVFRWFELWDTQLLTIAEVSSTEARDEIHFARISPRDAEYIGKDASQKLAGDQLGHFGGFLSQRWRENDLLWGRLDAAEMICRMIEGPVDDDTPAALPEALIKAVQEQIFGKEIGSVPPDHPDYRSYLESDDYGVGAEKLDAIPIKELTDLVLRSGGVARNMLRALGKAERLPELLQKLFSWLGTGLDLLLKVARGPARLWARIVEAVKKS
jgi:hypothetical protein